MERNVGFSRPLDFPQCGEPGGGDLIGQTAFSAQVTDQSIKAFTRTGQVLRNDHPKPYGQLLREAGHFLPLHIDRSLVRVISAFKVEVDGCGYPGMEEFYDGSYLT
jgi:hypothetical protein